MYSRSSAEYRSSSPGGCGHAPWFTFPSYPESITTSQSPAFTKHCPSKSGGNGLYHWSGMITLLVSGKRRQSSPAHVLQLVPMYSSLNSTEISQSVMIGFPSSSSPLIGVTLAEPYESSLQHSFTVLA